MPKKRTFTKKQEELFNQLKKLAKKANQRLVRLEREFGTNTWAAKKLRNRLEIDLLQAWTSTGRIKYNKNMSVIQMRAIIKATNQFLNSKTSTVRGVKNVIKRIKEDIKKNFNTDNMTDEDVETLYDALSDDYAKDLIEKLGASTFWTIITDAKEMNDSEEEFIERISWYLDFGNDDDMIDKLKIIYEKYVL